MGSENHSHRILIVEDEENARKGYEALLQRWNYHVLGVGTGEDALAKFPEFSPDVILADVELPGMNGLELLGHLSDRNPEIPAIIITGRGSEERVVQAIEAGAYWYIEKPLKPSVLQALLKRALELRESKQKVAALTRDLRSAGKLGALWVPLVGCRMCMRQVETAAPSTASVLITGETGSGKEMVARSIHMLSPRADRAICGDQLLGNPGITDGKRNIRPREGRIHGSGGTAHRLFRTGTWRDAATRRNWRDAAADASEAVARAGGPKNQAAGQQGRNAGGRPSAGRYEQKPRAGGRRWTLRQDLYFQAECFPHPLAPFARIIRGISGTDRPFTGGYFRETREKSYRRGRGCDGAFQVLPVAWQCAGTSKRLGTCGNRIRSRNHQSPTFAI